MEAFKKIIGYDSIKEELYQIIDMFKNSEVYEEMGAKLPKGVLLHGVPGIGKTLLAEAFIKECNVKTFVVKKKGTEEDCISRIIDAFEQARKEDKAIIFFDDLDKFSESDEDDVDDKTFTTIQSEMDDCKCHNVLVLCTVNNIRKFPRSLVRNGRFDRKIHVKAPTNEDAKKIIEFYLKTKKVNDNLNYDDVYRMINYTSCADLDSIINTSAIHAAYKRKDSIDIEDILDSYLKEMCYLPDDNYKQTPEEIKKTSIHEAGHAVVAELIKKGSVGVVTVFPTGRNEANGFTHMCEDLDRRVYQILVALGGKVATEMYYGGICASGCFSDLEKAINLVRDGISESGTVGIGMLDVANRRFPTTSESMNSRNEAVTQAELERYIFIVKDMLIKNKDFLEKLTEELKVKNTLLYSDIQRIRDSVKITEVPV